MNFVKRIVSGKITAYLRVYQLKSGKCGIETRIYNKEKWEVNVNLPLFDSQEETEKWLKSNYELAE
ncbi:MAG: hypothetical protein NC401_06505 [Ruminococcus sp.]|nr:hypothetical protein [Ruminococcus sp.]